MARLRIGGPRIYTRRDGQLYVDLGTINGRRVRQSLETTDPAEAAKRAAKITKAQISGTYKTPADRAVTVGELLDDLVTDVKLRGLAGLSHIMSHIKHLREAFGHRPAAGLDTKTVQEYQQDRLDLPRAPATVNRECEFLRQAFNLAFERTPQKVKLVPTIPMLTEDNARQGWLDPAEVAALLNAIENDDVRDFLEFFSWTGMRPKEIRSLTWGLVDLREWTLDLNPKHAKTKKGRIIALVGPIRAVIERRLKARLLHVPLIFHRPSWLKARGQKTTYSPGQPIRTYKEFWDPAVKAAGLHKRETPLVPYDLRRTALRNMILAGVDIAVAMKISGHLTRGTFDRYNIIAPAQIREGLEKVVAYVGNAPARGAQ